MRRALSPPSLIHRTFLVFRLNLKLWEAGVAQDTAQKTVSPAAPAGASTRLPGGERRARWGFCRAGRSPGARAKCAPIGPRLSSLDPAGRGGAEPRLDLRERVPLRETAEGVPIRGTPGE